MDAHGMAPLTAEAAAHVDRLCSMAAALLDVPAVRFLRSTNSEQEHDGQPGNATGELPSPAMSHAGVSLINAAGDSIGCLYAIGLQPRHWSRRDYGVLATVRDLILLALELQDSDLRKRAGMAEIVHDLRQPLNLIAISGETLALAGAQKIQAHCAVLQQSMKTMKVLINGLIDEPGIQPASPLRLSIDPVTLLAGMARSHAPAAAHRGLTIVSHAPSGLPAFHGDPTQMERVFANLIDNAIKFARPASVIRLSAAAGDGHLEFSVVNDGSSIAATDVARVFERGWQAAGHPEGRGLGLSIVDRIVRELGGSIEARSLGTTTSFCLRLPLLPDTCRSPAPLYAALQAA